MISSIKAIYTGKFTEIFQYEKPFQYGYTSPKSSISNPVVTTPQDRLTRISSNRAKNKIRRLIIGNINNYPQYRPVFLTLTYRENQQNLKLANYQFSLFIRRLSRTVGHHLRYVAVPEYQHRGAIHYHILLLNLPYLQGKVIEQIWQYGMTHIRIANRGYRVFNYITKYITKSFTDDRFKNQRRYFHSLEHQPITIRKQEISYQIYLDLADQDLIGKYEYDVKDRNDIAINHVQKLEYLST